MTYKHTHVNIKKFQSNMYEHLNKLEDGSQLVVTNRGQAVYTVSLADEANTADLGQATTVAALDDIKKPKIRQKGKHEHENPR